MGLRLRRYQQSLQRHRRFLRSYRRSLSRSTIGIATAATADRLRDHDKGAGIGNNLAEIGDNAAGIVDIAAKVIPC